MLSEDVQRQTRVTLNFLTLKRVTLNFTNPLVNVALKFYVVRLISAFKSINPDRPSLLSLSDDLEK